MVDFNKRLGKAPSKKPIIPSEIYGTLDRTSDKGPLRPAQTEILNSWHLHNRSQRDTIVKLHTGQGKTLIGLLMLQSKLNEIGGPTLYLCPNNFLVKQTCLQARQFGFRYCEADGGLPHEFTEGEAILITTVHKLFNGLTQFGTGAKSVPVTSLLMDDCHACIDSIRDSFSIKIKRGNPAYIQLVDLFSTDLESQGVGTFVDIRTKKKGDAILPVSYWEWADKHQEVASILSKNGISDEIRYAWPIIKDVLHNCQCVVSSEGLEISPYLPPLDFFGSYYKAKHRIFMSATVTDDSFLVKGLRLNPETIKNPLVYKKETWSGEKMVLIPSLIDVSLDRSRIVNEIGKQRKKSLGIVALAPSFSRTADWEACGAVIAKKDTIEDEIEKLKSGKLEPPLVIVNRYDGIDLPDETCRVLVVDSKPYSDSLIDRYAEHCRATSEVIAIRTARTIEQGLGRSVRGEKDYCVFILIGEDLVKTIRSQASRKYFSAQTQAQVEIGLEIAEMAKEEIENGTEPFAALKNLINQCLKRDSGWKAFYVEKMDVIKQKGMTSKVLNIFEQEREAEEAFLDEQFEKAVQITQKMLDRDVQDPLDKGWYMQAMARYTYSQSKVDSNKLQIAAHRQNKSLLKPKSGMQVDRLVVSPRRVEEIIKWVGAHDNHEQLIVSVDAILGSLQFGVKAERFEQALNDLGKALGFASERPDKSWKEGPDNLWCLRDGLYLLIECKNEVALDRAEIQKDESGQMNNACAWFENNYPGATAANIMIIPTPKISKAAGFNLDVKIMRKRELTKLAANVRAFFKEFQGLDLKSLSDKKIQKLIETHGLSVESLTSDYSVLSVSAR
jgi:replicative superfamily II helicase